MQHRNKPADGEGNTLTLTWKMCFALRAAGLREWWKKEAKSDLMVYGTSLAVALTIRTVALEPRYIPSLSMFPTFEVGDQLAVDKLSAKLSRPYQRKDVVVFYPPPAFLEFSTRGTNEVRIKQSTCCDDFALVRPAKRSIYIAGISVGYVSPPIDASRLFP